MNICFNLSCKTIFKNVWVGINIPTFPSIKETFKLQNYIHVYYYTSQEKKNWNFISRTKFLILSVLKTKIMDKER